VVAIRLSEKLKKLKFELKMWNVEVFGNLEFKISSLWSRLRSLV
jgi:hypothetical protein